MKKIRVTLNDGTEWGGHTLYIEDNDGVAEVRHEGEPTAHAGRSTFCTFGGGRSTSHVQIKVERIE